MDAETRRKAVIDLALEYHNLLQKADDIGVIGFGVLGGVQMTFEIFRETFGETDFKVEKRNSERFPYEAYVESYSGRCYAVLTADQFEELGVAADE